MTFLLILLVVFFCSGESLAEKPAVPAPGDALIWPPPPEKARVKFLYTFREPRELGFSTSFFKRLKDLVLGGEDTAMVRPYSIAVEDRLIAVADPGAQALHLYDTNSKKYKKITKGGKYVFPSPVGVALGQGRIYLSDSSLSKIFVLDEEGRYIFAIEGLARPTGLAFHKKKMRLYAADTLGDRIVVFDKEGREIFSFGQRGKGEGELNSPTHLFISKDKLYVNDAMNFRIQVFNLEGNYLSSFGSHGDGSGDFAQPKGVGVDEEGHIYVVDALFDRVQIFDDQGRFLLAFGGPGSGLGEFWLPSGFYLSRDQIYVADSYNRRVQVFRFLGGNQE